MSFLTNQKRKPTMAKSKTGALPGMERKGIKEIEDLADEYVGFRDARMEQLKKEVPAKAALIAAMKKYKQEVYEFEEDGKTVTVTLKTDEKVKVSRGDSTDEDD